MGVEGSRSFPARSSRVGKRIDYRLALNLSMPVGREFVVLRTGSGPGGARRAAEGSRVSATGLQRPLQIATRILIFGGITSSSSTS